MKECLRVIKEVTLSRIKVIDFLNNIIIGVFECGNDQLTVTLRNIVLAEYYYTHKRDLNGLRWVTHTLYFNDVLLFQLL